MASWPRPPHVSRTIKALGIDTSHFRPYVPNHIPHKRQPSQVLIRLPDGSAREKPHALKRVLMEIGRPHVCASCGNDGTWMGQPLTLDVDHIDGDFLNNEATNLRFLCPNCHRQTPNFAGRSSGRYTRNRSDPHRLDSAVVAAEVVELADTRHLGCRAPGRAGSSPAFGTQFNLGRAEPEPTRGRAARQLHGRIEPSRPAPQASNCATSGAISRNALPRCEMASLSSRDNSAVVTSGNSSATNSTS